MQELKYRIFNNYRPFISIFIFFKNKDKNKKHYAYIVSMAYSYIYSNNIYAINRFHINIMAVDENHLIVWKLLYS